ncbi:hypothetical protein Tco_1338110 [Tanacetum coccineum]
MSLLCKCLRYRNPSRNPFLVTLLVHLPHLGGHGTLADDVTSPMPVAALALIYCSTSSRAMFIASCKVGESFEEVIFPLILSGNPRMYFQSSCFQWAPIQNTSELVHGSDCCKPRYHLLSKSESKVLVPSFGFQLLAMLFQSSS